MLIGELMTLFSNDSGFIFGCLYDEFLNGTSSYGKFWINFWHLPNTCIVLKKYLNSMRKLFVLDFIRNNPHTRYVDGNLEVSNHVWR